MTGSSAPSPPRGGRPSHLADLFGLWVDLGDYHTKRRVWLSYPSARFTCRWGCELTASGPAEVADLTKHLAHDHARICPGPTTKTTPRKTTT